VTSPLPIKVTRRAAREIAKACEWWDANRPAAPGAVRQEIARAFRLIAHQPGVGARVKNARLADVRRVHLSRVHSHLYYRVRSDPAAVEILAF
jgi:plasmid stabilization system protein ParE